MTPSSESPPAAGPRPIERVVLLGYMCSGKSSVGEALARRLEWRFLDFDVEIERREGRSVHDVIEAEGEDYFRAAEAALTEEIAHEPRLVAAPGGGWITRPELLDAIRPGTFSAWLDVSPEETLRRLRTDPIDRPLKDVRDPLPRIIEMLNEREPLFRLADARLPANVRSAEELAFELEQTVRTRGILTL
ncbi:MAG TPA: shikimate kinase [Longimicrobiaceae bacterium]|nr:shikimate kinase [Longimicrobiaceae bacterium]